MLCIAGKEALTDNHMVSIKKINAKGMKSVTQPLQLATKRITFHLLKLSV